MCVYVCVCACVFVYVFVFVYVLALVGLVGQCVFVCTRVVCVRVLFVRLRRCVCACASVCVSVRACEYLLPEARGILILQIK